MNRRPIQTEVDSTNSTWAIGLPFGGADATNQKWISALSAHLVSSGASVVWGVQVGPNQPPAPEGVVIYPYSDLNPRLMESTSPGGPLLLNLDGPSPYADRTRHLWRSFNLGARDVFLLPEARLAELESLWDIYAFTDISQVPVTVLRLAELSPSGKVAMSYDEIVERLRWVAYRLNMLDLPGKKVIIWPGSTVIAQLLESAGLAAAAVIPVTAAAQSRGALIAVAAVGQDEEQLIARLGDCVGDRPLDVVCLSPADVARLKSAASFDVHDVGDPLNGHYDRIVVAADAVFAVARAGIDAAGPAFILDDADDATWGAITSPVSPHQPAPAVTPEVLAARLLELLAGASARAPAPRPVVVHIAPAWPSAGSTHVFQGQLEWLRKRGLPTVCLHLDTADLDWHNELATAPELLSRLPGEQALQRWFLSRPREERQAEVAAGIPAPYDSLSLEGEERIARQVRLPSSLVAFLKYRKVHFVVLNYGHNWPIVERLGLEGHPIALETHDIRPIQHALYNTMPVIESALDIELAMFARGTCAIFINSQERTLFEGLYPKSAAVGAFPFRDKPLPATVRSRFETPVTALLSAPELSLDTIRDLLVPRAERRRRFAVFVGSNHPANVASLYWFFLNAYPDHLVHSDLTIIVAGAIDEAFMDANLPNVVFCGRLPELDLLYRAADVLLLPVTAGTGLPIKTLDALTAGVPFVATSKAMEAIPGLAELAGVHDSGPAFAERVLTLAFDDRVRATFTKKIEDYRARHANQGEYERAWDEVLKIMKIPDIKGLPGPVGSGLAPCVDRPAGRLNERYYFWDGHGLEETLGALQEGDGIMLGAPYVRLGLSCTPAFPAKNGSLERLEVTARLAAGEKTRALVAFQGTLRGSFTLEAGLPMHIALDASLPSRGRPHRLSLEIRLESPTGEPPSPVLLHQLAAASLP